MESTKQPARSMPRLAERSLESSYIAARREYELAAESREVVERHLRLLGQHVRVRFAGDQLADVLLEALVHRVGPRPVAKPDATIDVWERRGVAITFPWAANEIRPGGLVRDHGDDRFVAVHDTYADAVTLVDRPRRALLYRVSDAESLPWWDRCSPLKTALFWAMAGDGPRFVHAGAVGDERGCVLLAGAPRSGKTTLALAAAAHGFRYLGDDSVLLYRDVAGSIYSTAGVRIDAGTDESNVMDVAAAFPGSLCDALPVRAVVVPRIDGSRTRLDPIEPSQALLSWAPSTALRLPFDEGEVVTTLATLVRRVPCFALSVGDDPRQQAEAVDEALARAAGR
jgi:hypothetical protein